MISLPYAVFVTDVEAGQPEPCYVFAQHTQFIIQERFQDGALLTDPLVSQRKPRGFIDVVSPHFTEYSKKVMNGT